MEGFGEVPFPYTSMLFMTDFDRVPAENWVVGRDVVQEVLNRVRPTFESEDERRRVFEYLRRIIECSDPVIKVFPYGSVPLKTYLNDGDLDLTVIGDENIAFPGHIVKILEIEKENENAEFKIQDINCIYAEVKIIKCNVGGFSIDISWNQLGGLCSLGFLEQVDILIGKDNLFKRSIILIKSWCSYESHIHGASSGLLSTYALETLILYIFIIFYDSLIDPLMVLYRFLEYYSRFDWEHYCISLYGRVELSQLHNVTFETPVNVMLGEKSLKHYIDMFAVPSKRSETYMPRLQRKYLNISDPLKATNNLGRSVSKCNFPRIICALRDSDRSLSEVMLLPRENLRDGIKTFFQNTLEKNPLKLFEISTPPSVMVTEVLTNEDQSNWSNGHLESLDTVNLSGDYASHIRNLANAKSFKRFDLETAVADRLTSGSGAPYRPILSGQKAIEASGNSANMVWGTGSSVPVTIRRGRAPRLDILDHQVRTGSTNGAGPSAGPTYLPAHHIRTGSTNGAGPSTGPSNLPAHHVRNASTNGAGPSTGPTHLRAHHVRNRSKNGAGRSTGPTHLPTHHVRTGSTNVAGPSTGPTHLPAHHVHNGSTISAGPSTGPTHLRAHHLRNGSTNGAGPSTGPTHLRAHHVHTGSTNGAGPSTGPTHLPAHHVHTGSTNGAGPSTGPTHLRAHHVHTGSTYGAGLSTSPSHLRALHVRTGSTNGAGPSTCPTHLRVPVFGSFGPVTITRSRIFRVREEPVRLVDDAQFPPLMPFE